VRTRFIPRLQGCPKFSGAIAKAYRTSKQTNKAKQHPGLDGLTLFCGVPILLRNKNSRPEEKLRW
jgi:hypothetical protein